MFQQTLQTGTRSMQAEQIDRSLHHLSSLLNNGTDPNTVKQHADEIIGHLEELTFQIDKNTSLDEGDKKKRWEIANYLFDTLKILREKIDKKITQQLMNNRGNPVVINIGKFPEDAELPSQSRLKSFWVDSAKPLLVKIGIGVLFGVCGVGVWFCI